MTILSSIPVKKLKQFLIPIIIVLCFVGVYISIPSEKDTFDNKNDEDSIKNRVENDNFTSTNNITAKPLEINWNFNYTTTSVNYNFHIFYYAWFGNVESDGKWIHWNHKRVPHWNQGLISEYSQAGHYPPDDIGSDFYPALGLYSSRNITIIRQHLTMIRYTGVGVVVLSWYTKDKADPNGIPMDRLVDIVLNESFKLQLKVALHLEPYPRRSIYSVKDDLSYIYKNYANHPAYYKRLRFKTQKPLPVVFIYDSYLISSYDWSQIFGIKRPRTIRGEPNDFFVVGLLLDRDSCNELSQSGFDAGYTYFAGEQVSFSSGSTHWTEINRKCSLKNIEFYPSIGPGYKDASVRPWNEFVTQDRSNGQFYLNKFQKAKESGARLIGITSFNEWHEGTQIEPAVPHWNPGNGLKYENYLPNSPTFYLDLTKKFVQSFLKNIHLDI